MKKGLTAAIVVVIVLVVAGGAYALMHKSDNQPTTTTTKGTTSNAPAINNAIVITKTDATVGQYLATPDGKPLYTYASDTNGVSNCTGACLANWPAYQDTGSTSNLPVGVGTIKRTDNGQAQFTYNGMPLYTFTGDQGSSVTGNGVAKFSVAKPAAASSSSSSSASSQPASSSSNTSSSASSGSGW